MSNTPARPTATSSRWMVRLRPDARATTRTADRGGPRGEQREQLGFPAHLGEEHEERPEADARDSGVDQRRHGRPHVMRVGRRRAAEQHDGDDGDRYAHQRPRTRTFTGHDADEHRHDGSDHRAHGCGDAHGPDRKPAVERDEAHRAGDSSRRRPRHVGRVRISAEERGDRDDEHEAHELAREHHCEGRADPSSRQPAEEVAGPVRGRAEEGQDDRHDRRALSRARRCDR